MRNAVITARVDDDTADKFELIANYTGRSRSWHAAQALKSYADQEAQFLAFVDEGHQAIDHGEIVDQAEADRRISALIERLRAKR